MVCSIRKKIRTLVFRTYLISFQGSLPRYGGVDGGGGGPIIFRLHFSTFLSTLGRVLQIFCPLKSTSFKFLSVLGHKFFSFFSSGAIKMRFCISGTACKLRSYCMSSIRCKNEIVYPLYRVTQKSTPL